MIKIDQNEFKAQESLFASTFTTKTDGRFRFHISFSTKLITDNLGRSKFSSCIQGQQASKKKCHYQLFRLLKI